MAHFQVHISSEELAEIEGAPLVLDPGQTLHEAVLDYLQRYAQERNDAVEATVNDSRDAARFVLQVSPDGSSRILEAGEAVAPEPAVAPAVATAIDRPTAEARAALPALVDTMDPLPTGFAEPVCRINALAAVGRLDEAFADATVLREILTSSVGAEHPDAVEARALEAYVAHLRGDHREAVVLALAVARIRCGTGDERAPADVARAAAAWQRLDDEWASFTHGCELLHICDTLERRGPLPPGYAELAEQVRRHVEALEGTSV